MRAQWRPLLRLGGHRVLAATPCLRRVLRISAHRTAHSTSHFDELLDIGSRPVINPSSDSGATTTSLPNYLIDPLADQPNAPSSDALLELSQRRLLGRARLHGIQSLEQLDHEVNIGHSYDIGTRLIDRPEHRDDLDLWLFLLEVSKQRHGIDGILNIYVALRYRGKPLKLYSDNANARDLVEAILFAGIHSGLDKLKSICLFCIRNFYLQDQLFMGVVGGLLRYNPDDAVTMAKFLMQQGCYQGTDDFMQVFRSATESEDIYALRICDDVWKEVCGQKVYDDTISYLWKNKFAAQAFEWHQLRLSRRDLPQNMQVLLPFIGHLACKNEPIEPFLQGLHHAGVDYTHQINRVYEREVARFKAEPDLRTEFDPWLTKPEKTRSMRDETVARAFATSGFSFDFVVNSLRMLGAFEVGPLSIRQMVIDAPDMETLEHRFQKLEELRMDTGSSPFVNVIRDLRASKDFKMSKLIATSDMHHDEFLDMALQRSLLNRCMQSKDLEGISRTLRIMRSGSAEYASMTDREAREHVTNFLLRGAVTRQDWQSVLNIVVSLHRSGHGIENDTLLALARGCLEAAPQQQQAADQLLAADVAPFDLTWFLAGIFQQISASGTRVPLHYWRLIIVGFAKHHRTDEMYRLLSWLINYWTDERATASRLGRQHTIDLSSMFDPVFQQALIAWDFKRTKWYHRSRHSRVRQKLAAEFDPSDDGHLVTSDTAPWLKGVRLLIKLSKRPGFKMQTDYRALQREYLNRIRELYNVGVSSKSSGNLKWATDRGISAIRMVDHWAEIWNIDSDATRAILRGSAVRIMAGATRKGKWRSERDMQGRHIRGERLSRGRYARLRKAESESVGPADELLESLSSKVITLAEKKKQN